MFLIERGRNLIVIFATICVFFLSTILCFNISNCINYSLYLIPFGIGLLILFAFFILLKKLLKDRKAKSFKWSFLTNISCKLAKKENRFNLYLAISTIALFIIFFIRFYFFKNNISYTVDGVGHYYKYYDFLHLTSQLISDKLYSVVELTHLERSLATIFNDLWVASIILALVCSIYLKDTSIRVRRYIGTPIAILVSIISPIIIKGLIGNDNTTYRIILMGIELAFIDFYFFSSYLEKETFKCNKKQILTLLALCVPILISSMSSYTPSNVLGYTIFGLGNPHELKDLSHRLLFYFSFILPIMYYFLLHPLNKNERRSALIQISLGTLFGYISINRYDIWTNLSSWPLHLCNTAMYTMPITLLFMSYGLFYFTFFINVLGAFFALTMPNYSSSISFLAPQIFEFYINHWHAFFMPVLIVILGVYKRPKMKYFIYSQIGFFVYFALVMFINTYLTAHGTSSDFFFINSDFIADKLGEWAKNLFNTTIAFTINGYNYVVHLAYDISYYLVYVVLAFAMRFLYELLFRAVDEHELLIYAKTNCISRHEAYLIKKSLGGLSMENDKITLTISHLTKKYHGADKNTVNDFSINLEGGKIYGFLGKNGAGKSTIIKSIVGIHGFEGGYIEACGYDVIEKPLEAKKVIGYVPDNYALYENLTGRQYINYIADLYNVSKEDRKTREEDLVKRIEMVDRYDKPMKTYSHGMKQKITIIAALIHEPKIWILDEPMTGLDPNSIYQIKECMKEHAKKGNIVFFSSHIIDVVKNLCDEVIIIKHGDLVKHIDLDANPNERDTLEKTFLMLTSDNIDEETTLLKEEEKGQVL